jgi:hypothetical protein
MAKETVNGVTQYFGPRSQWDGVSGTQGRLNDVREVTFFISGGNLSAVTFSLPAGATVVGNALIEVQEAFNLGGTTPVINIGVSGSAGTNRLAQVSEAQAEALGTYSVASAGTLAVNTPLAAAQTIVVELGGTTPTDAGVGKMKVVVPVRII